MESNDTNAEQKKFKLSGKTLKKVSSVVQVGVLLAALALSLWSMNEASVQQRNASDATEQLVQMQDAYEAASDRADGLQTQLTAARKQVETLRRKQEKDREREKEAQAAAEQTDPNAAEGSASGVNAVDNSAESPVLQQTGETKLLTRAEANTLASQYKTNIYAGKNIGRVWVEGTAVSCGLYWGDTASILNAGGGCANYSGCVLPGENGTVFIGGHTGSFFKDLKSAKIGSIIHLQTPWGDFRYKISSSRVIQETDTASCYWGATQPRCILYTCYPFGILEHTTQRYLVYADPIASDSQGVLPYGPA